MLQRSSQPAAGGAVSGISDVETTWAELSMRQLQLTTVMANFEVQNMAMTAYYQPHNHSKEQRIATGEKIMHAPMGTTKQAVHTRGRAHTFGASGIMRSLTLSSSLSFSMPLSFAMRARNGSLAAPNWAPSALA